MQTTSVTRATRRRIATALAVGLVTALAGTLLSAPTAGAAPAAGATSQVRAAKPSFSHLRLNRWSSVKELRRGSNHGTRVNKYGTIDFRRSIGTTKFHGRRYDRAHWTSPWARTGFNADKIIASWNAVTPRRTWIKVQLRGKKANGKRGSWDTLAYWASDDHRIKRTSLGKQRDDYSSVNVDTVTLDGHHRYRQWKVRVTLYRPKGSHRAPKLRSVGAVASELPSHAGATSRTTVKHKVELKVPRYSQMIHDGDYPKWDGGGEAWCSPTSTSMVLRAFHSGPTRKDYRWVKKPHKNRFVDYAARSVYDYQYEGAGNWPFNTAYAGTFGLDAFVTRLRSLRDAERLVRAGIPVVVSIAFGRGGLDGSPLTSTPGHLLVVVGFTKRGKPIVNDPSAAHNRGVRHIYKRGQFERAWLNGSGGVAYVIHPKNVRLPARRGTHRW